jgi:hypothetical protein
MITTEENKSIWDQISQHQKALSILRYKLRQLPIEQQIATLKYAYAIDDEKFVLEFILRTEPVDFRQSKRELTIGLLDQVVSGAVFPGTNEFAAQKLLVGLVNYFPRYDDVIYKKCLTHMDEADIDSDYEVYQRVYNLLIDVKSDHLDNFVERCSNHESPDIREIVED